MKRFSLILSVVAVSLMSVSFAAAQDPVAPVGQEQAAPRFNRQGAFVDIVAAATGLEREAVIEQLQAGSTFAEIIAANGGDLEAIQAEFVAELVAERGLDEAEAQARVEGILNNVPRPENENGAPQGTRGGAFVNAVAAATGLEREAVIEQLEAGSTFAEIIAANGGDLEAIQAELVAAMVERGVEEAEAQERVAEHLNSVLGPEDREAGEEAEEGQGQRGNGVIEAVAAATGLEAEAIREQLEAGSTIAEIVAANGGDLATIQANLVAELVERGLDEAEAQARIAERLNGQFQPGNGQGPRGNGQQGGGFGPGNGQGGQNGQQGGPRGNNPQGQNGQQGGAAPQNQAPQGQNG